MLGAKLDCSKYKLNLENCKDGRWGAFNANLAFFGDAYLRLRSEIHGAVLVCKSAQTEARQTASLYSQIETSVPCFNSSHRALMIVD
jgi:hypothetical protein